MGNHARGRQKRESILINGHDHPNDSRSGMLLTRRIWPSIASKQLPTRPATPSQVTQRRKSSRRMTQPSVPQQLLARLNKMRLPKRTLAPKVSPSQSEHHLHLRPRDARRVTRELLRLSRKLRNLLLPAKHPQRRRRRARNLRKNQLHLRLKYRRGRRNQRRMRERANWGIERGSGQRRCNTHCVVLGFASVQG